MIEPFALKAGVETVLGDAILSPCGLYRYSLTRDWSGGGEPHKVVFVMLNPSIADATKPDPTMTRCKNFAHHWGFNRMVIVNLFALRATDPRELTHHPDPVGPLNDEHIRRDLADAEQVICAWGLGGLLMGRGQQVLANIRRMGVTPYCLQRTKGGYPQHPLYSPRNAVPMPLREETDDA